MSTWWRWIILTGVYTGPSERHKKEECMCCMCVNYQCHSLFMCLYGLVSNYCSCMCMYQCQSVSQRATSNHRKATIIPSIIRSSGLVHTVWDLILYANWCGSWLLLLWGRVKTWKQIYIEMCLGQSVGEYISYFINIVGLISGKRKTKEMSTTQRYGKECLKCRLSA